MSENSPFQISDFRYIDSHVHMFPERLFRAIWAYWERVYLPIYPTWINKYQWSPNKLVEFLRETKIERYTTLNYAHKKGVAEDLNTWTNEFCKKNQDAVPFGTVHPDDDNFLDYSQKALIEYNFKGFKFQLMITDFFIHDERLKPLYKIFRDYDKILYLHAGTAPGPNQRPPPGTKVGFKHFIKFFHEFPDIKMVIAHMGLYECRDFFKIVEDHSNVYLDTTMVFIDPLKHVFPKGDHPFNFVGKSRLLAFMEENSTQILHGSDFPNIPYDYVESIKGLLSLNLSKQAYSNLFYNTAKKLFNL